MLHWSVEYLTQKGVEDARTAVEWMLTSLLNMSRVDLYLNFDRPISRNELDRYKPLLLKCAAHQPVQQVIGQADFYGLQLTVSPHVLIPRPETERLVDYVIEKTKSRKEPFHILDIGSGTGAIAIAIAKHRPLAYIHALEISPVAVDILKKNCRFHNVENQITIIQEDIFQWEPSNPYDIIVSNPPYIASQEMASLPRNVGYYEPPLALTDNDDGLTFYRFFAVHFKDWLVSGGMAVLEFGGPAQSDAIKKIFHAYQDVTIHTDYQKDDRFVSFFRP
ncbi:MAG: peptide chain release factor N(5)-glutamine methyltransferase [Candidatus Marinimicrobia bacterium]|nr:peptide chain release factor N(5)-glutamine methyltransferase [Candidatus Neomarinimicrobiota bacterium]MDD5582793.1 peptide chain release factor N(5)-glutamine methyltransferase [Candidatus Neomarinimicrobiota bacterium]